MQFFLKKFNRVNNVGRCSFFSHLVELHKHFIGLALVAGAVGKLVSREPLFVTRCVGKLRGEPVLLRGRAVVMIFFFVEHAQSLVQEMPVGVVPDAAFEKIPAKIEILALRLDSQRLARLFGILARGDARVPSHVPRGHVPEQERAGLQRGHAVEKQRHAPPLRALPRLVRLNPEKIGDQRAKPAQRRKKTRLPDPFAQGEIELRAVEICGAMRRSGSFSKFSFEKPNRRMPQTTSSHLITTPSWRTPDMRPAGKRRRR